MFFAVSVKPTKRPVLANVLAKKRSQPSAGIATKKSKPEDTSSDPYADCFDLSGLMSLVVPEDADGLMLVDPMINVDGPMPADPMINTVAHVPPPTVFTPPAALTTHNSGEQLSLDIPSYLRYKV